MAVRASGGIRAPYVEEFVRESNSPTGEAFVKPGNTTGPTEGSPQVIPGNHDDTMFPKFRRWQQEFQDESLTLWDYVTANADIEIVGAAATLFWPAVIEHEGCILLQDQFSEPAFAQWRNYYQGDIPAIERMMNHLHLVDLFVNSYEQESLPTLDFVGQIMARCWRSALHEQFPDRQFEVEYAANLQDDGPTITFFQI